MNPGSDALNQLVEYGWFTRREDGCCYVSKLPSRKDLPEFTRLLLKVGQYTVPTIATEAPIQVTSGDREIGPLFKSKKV